MPRKPKPPQAWTNEDVLRRLFPNEARQKVRREARKAAEKGGRRSIKEDLAHERPCVK
jgi:hypothetical protein